MSREGNLLGAQREMQVSLDLMSKDFVVFRPLSTASCDLIALKYGLCLRIEVKGTRSRGRVIKGPIGCTDTKMLADCRDFDVFAQVVDESTIVYARSVLHEPNQASKELGMTEYSPHTTKRYIERARKLKEEHDAHDQDGASQQDQG